MIDLSSNESPYNYPEEVLKHIDKCYLDINKYLDYKKLNELVKEISNYCNVEENRIIIGSGTDNLINKVILKFFKNRDLVVLNPNFYSALNLAKDLEMKIRRIQLKPSNFHINWDCLKIKNSIILIDYPNNPTGDFLIKKEELEKLLNNNNIVIIDEAGYEYSKVTFIDLVNKYENLVVTRTFDKAFALAGLKVSYMIMGNNILKEVDKKIDINKPAFVGALEALKNKKYIEECIFKTLNERKFVETNLMNIGLKVYKSEANFVLIKTDIPDFALQLSKKGILIEDLSKFWINGYYRISIGNNEENKKLIDEVKIIYKNNN